MGGMESASVNLANALNSANQEVVFVSFFKQEHFFKLNAGILLIEPADFNNHKLSFLKTIFWLRKTIKKVNPKQVIVFNKLYSAITCLSLIFLNFKVFISERSSPLYQWPKHQELLISLIFTILKPFGVISQTNIAKSYQEKFYGEKVKIEVIPNAIRPVIVYPEITRKKVVLAVGRFNDYLKGFDRLLLSFANTSFQDWQLHFAGGSSMEDAQLEKIIIENKLENRVKFLGKVKDLDMVFAEASIFVIPSRSEGFPNALCEAMAAGLACISYDFIAGPKDIIVDRENGVLVDNGNIAQLSFELQQLMSNEYERIRLGRNAIQSAERFSNSNISQRIIAFLNHA